MALYQVDIEKQLGSEYWTNRYFVNSPTLAEADLAGMQIQNRERLFHRTAVTFTKRRVSDTVPNTSNFIVTPVFQPGELAKNGAFLPLFNVLRVDFSVVGSGRPSRKYYRMPLCAGDITSDFNIDSGITSAVQAHLVSLIATMDLDYSPIVDPDLQPWVAPAVYLAVAMRQLRRGTRRRTEPIL